MSLAARTLSPLQTFGVYLLGNVYVRSMPWNPALRAYVTKVEYELPKKFSWDPNNSLPVEYQERLEDDRSMAFGS